MCCPPQLISWHESPWFKFTTKSPFGAGSPFVHFTNPFSILKNYFKTIELSTILFHTVASILLKITHHLHNVIRLSLSCMYAECWETSSQSDRGSCARTAKQPASCTCARPSHSGCWSACVDGYKKRKHSQNVFTIAQRMRVVQRMIKTEERVDPKHIVWKAVKAFPLLFHKSTGADNMRGMHLWWSRDSFEIFGGVIKRRVVTSCMTRNTINGLRMVSLKAGKGRGRKCEAWVEALHIGLRSKFERLRQLGVKFSFSTIRLLALKLPEESDNGTNTSNLIDQWSGKIMSEKLTYIGFNLLLTAFEPSVAVSQESYKSARQVARDWAWSCSSFRPAQGRIWQWRVWWR